MEKRWLIVKSDEQIYRVKGLSCANCAGKFERNVKALQGVTDAKVNFGAGKISVYGETTVEALEQAGAFEHLKIIPEHQVKTAVGENEVGKPPYYKEYSSLLYATVFLLIGIISSFINGELNPVTILLFATSITVSGYDLLKIGCKNLLKFDFDMKTLMTVAVIGGAIIGEWLEVAVVVILFALSEELERFSIDQARQSIRSLMEIAPNEALIRRDGQEIILAVTEIEIGDIMIVKPGEKIAMDGIVSAGHSSVNQAAITGESVSVEKRQKDTVFAGTLNEEGTLEIQVTKLVNDTTIAKIIHLVEEAQAEQAPAQAFVDRFAQYYTPIIMGIALLVAIIPPLILDLSWKTWVYQGLAVLVVGCPCALVVSTPISIVSAIGNAAKKGVLIKGGIYLEKIGTLKAIAFDKTGTLTEGIPIVTDYQVFNKEKDQTDWLKIIAALERRSQHPLASAIIKKAEMLDYHSIIVEDFASITGKGVTGRIDSTNYYVGSPALFTNQLDQLIIEQIESYQKEGKTVMLFGKEKEILALIAVADKIRESSKTVIKQLHEVGIKELVMLTGDNQLTAMAIAEQTGITNVQAELMPDDKLAVIKEIRDYYGEVAMVGDGVNDAPALAAATVGIAMGSAGTDTAIETADVALMGDDLAKLPFIVKLSRQTLSIIKTNISFSILIKLVALLLVVPGWLTLWIAIVSDMGATLIVSLNSMRLIGVKE
ncbi:heavy metal translocating P-type ATPase [Amphibacillus sp. MSJ-3]|uniref:heavy metal translocating P-type ATPase n=1 Tax=Amphibacillus sp. MSJ-3 TaxID=2841505 RepID=UPI001C0F3302|nr:heavy metal translocating P-type ATPase [Amphibacillus sp. MSJ-3]MBU5595237.1 heavy metal translocating P-type ATPase [Amphibacillus sp. MSJ-3]